MFKKNKESPGKVDTIIGEETTLKGALTTNGLIRIDGKVECENEEKVSATADIIVGEKGELHANAKGKNITVAGKVKGNLECTSTLELLASGTIIGDIKAERIYVEEGSVFQGSCVMTKDEQGAGLQEETTERTAQLNESEKTEGIDEAEEKEHLSSSVDENIVSEKNADKTSISSQVEKDNEPFVNNEGDHAKIDDDSESKAADPNKNSEKIETDVKAEVEKPTINQEGPLLDHSGKIDLKEFQFNDQYEVKRCPNNISPIKSRFQSKKKTSIAYFNKSDCFSCEYFKFCRVKQQKKHLVLKISKKSLENIFQTS